MHTKSMHSVLKQKIQMMQTACKKCILCQSKYYGKYEMHVTGHMTMHEQAMRVAHHRPTFTFVSYCGAFRYNVWILAESLKRELCSLLGWPASSRCCSGDALEVERQRVGNAAVLDDHSLPSDCKVTVQGSVSRFQ